MRRVHVASTGALFGGGQMGSTLMTLNCVITHPDMQSYGVALCETPLSCITVCLARRTYQRSAADLTAQRTYQRVVQIHRTGRNQLGSIRLGSVLFAKNIIVFSLCFLNALWFGPVRFGFLFLPDRMGESGPGGVGPAEPGPAKQGHQQPQI